MKNLLIISTVLLILIGSGCKKEEVTVPEKTTSYNLVVKDILGVSGTITFYPASINVGSIATIGGGDIKKTLQSVNGSTGKSYTNIRSLNNDVVINYDNWLVYVGYINVYHTEPTNMNIISQGNIGAN